MKGDKLFKKYYEPKLAEQGIDNIVLRTYKHIKGFETDDPENSTSLIFSPRKEVDKRLEDIFSKEEQDRGIAVTSIVSFETEERLLFLLDCSLPISKDNEKQLIELLKSGKKFLPGLESGMILRTLNSFHVVGFSPLRKEEWYDHMGRVILMRVKSGEPVGDIRYIGHSIERGYGSLRITDYLNKPTPDFICYI